jgi:hypothetical protein
MTHIFRTGNLFLMVSIAASSFLLQGTRSAFGATNPRTGPEGKGQPHNNMPPYLVLRYCEKT